MEKSDQVSARAWVSSMPVPIRPGGWHRHGWGCAGFTSPADLPTAVQAAEPGRALAKKPGITLGTEIGEDWSEQSSQASRVRGSKKQERQVWEKDNTSSGLPPSSLHSLNQSFRGQIAWT